MTELDYDPALLPAADETVRCAAHAERIDLDPGGTALWLDELIVVDVPLPWPKPVWAATGFTAVPELVMAADASGRRVRVLAAVPLDDGVARVVTHRLVDDSTFARIEHRVDEDGVVDLLTVLLREGLEAAPATITSRAPVRELLLCTQGSHDVCCGSRGPSLERELETIDPGVRIRRISHTGGHRMAPTGITLPDGRMWGLVDCHEMMGVLARSVQPATVVHRCRGWIGAPGGPGQVAERAVFAALDTWSFDESPRRVSVVDAGDRWLVDVTTVEGVWVVEVVAGRAVPTIACGELGGLPAKGGTEWVVRTCEFRLPPPAQ